MVLVAESPQFVLEKKKTNPQLFFQSSCPHQKVFAEFGKIQLSKHSDMTELLIVNVPALALSRITLICNKIRLLEKKFSDCTIYQIGGNGSFTKDKNYSIAKVFFSFSFSIDNSLAYAAFFILSSSSFFSTFFISISSCMIFLQPSVRGVSTNAVVSKVTSTSGSSSHSPSHSTFLTPG